jgi:hypothetical protein
VPVLVPALPLLAVLTWWVFDDGGYAPTQWLPGTVVTLAVLAIVLVNRTVAAPPLPRPLRIGLVLLAGHAAWSYMSISWADDPGVALQGAHRALLFAAFPATVALLPWTAERLRWAAGTFVALVTLTAVVCLAKLHGAEHTSGLFLDRRLSFPTGYHNTTAALFTMAALTAVLLASRRTVSIALRAGLIGSATLLEGLALMSQSRSWLFTLPVVLIAAIGLIRQRVRVVMLLVPVAAGVAALSSRLLEPYRKAHGGPIDASPPALQAVHAVVVPLVLVAVLAALACLLIVLADRRIALDSRGELHVRRGARAIAVVLVIAGLGTGLAVEPHPVQRLRSSWHTFTHYEPARTGQEGSRFGGLGTGRYDVWRVGFDSFTSHPIEGLGQDNFIEAYLRARKTDEEPRWTHSLEIRALAHTGVVGFLLLFGALGGLLWGVIAARRASPQSGEVAAIAFAPAIVWVVHGSFDWLYEYPVLTCAALGLAAAAGSIGPRPRPRRRRGRVVPMAQCAVVLALMIAPTLEDIAQLDTGAAQSEWRHDSAGAFARLDRAKSLSPSSKPALVEGLIARELGQPARARRAFQTARDRDPQDWFAYLNLALLASETGDKATAADNYRAALNRNPLEPLLGEGLRRVRGRHPLRFQEVLDVLGARGARRLGQR